MIWRISRSNSIIKWQGYRVSASRLAGSKFSVTQVGRRDVRTVISFRRGDQAVCKRSRSGTSQLPASLNGTDLGAVRRTCSRRTTLKSAGGYPKARSICIRCCLWAHGDHLSNLHSAYPQAYHSGGYLYWGGQGLPATDGLSKAALAGRFPRRRVAVRGYRLRILHTPAHRPLRPEYFAPQRAVGPDFPEGKIRVSQARVRRLGGSD